jgi:hypothetical protein
MQRLRPGLAALFVLLCLSQLAAAAPPPARRAPPKQTPQFLRLTRDKNNVPLALETAVVRFAPAAGARTPTVDLVAAVHIADAAYYRQLNREFQAYDAVLYELVAAEESKTPKPGDHPSDNPISAMQNGMKDLLDLEFQLNVIDYTRKNMIHADMSPDQFAQSMHRRGESAWTMLGRMLAYAMAKDNQAGEASGGELLAAMFARNRALSLKRLLAGQFQQSEDALAAVEGPEGSTLISGRNQVATDVLRKQIAAGKKKIAIFYGAGHMPDLQKRLHDDFAMKPAGTRWLTAWNLKPETKPAAKAAKPTVGATKQPK